MAFAQEYPLGPDHRLTPGMLCELRVVFRYAERIPYCEREVAPEEKEIIFDQYRKLGYRLNPNARRNYKIDHYIPLCAGGSNSHLNLWPQHVSIYQVTDSIEFKVCEKMKDGKLAQKDAVSLIMTVKLDLSRAHEVNRYLDNLN